MTTDGFEAIFVGAGAGLPKFLGIPEKTTLVFSLQMNISLVVT